MKKITLAVLLLGCFGIACSQPLNDFNQDMMGVRNIFDDSRSNSDPCYASLYGPESLSFQDSPQEARARKAAYLDCRQRAYQQEVLDHLRWQRRQFNDGY